MSNTESKKLFLTDLDFCPDCGTVLPLPGQENVVICKGCDHKIDIRKFDGVEISSEIIFPKPPMAQAVQQPEESSGPTIDRRCGKCGNDIMTYTTRQTRSADEGQTVFYSCPKCNNQEIEYS